MNRELNPNFKKLIKDQFGLNFQGDNEQMLVRAVHARMRANGLLDQYLYQHKLTEDRDELHELVCLLTNNETYFYREAQQLQLLTDVLVPRIKAVRPNEPIRILSLGCSIGAEPYSIAIALHQKFGVSNDRRFSIMGGDVDHNALAVAKKACYRSLVFRALADELKQRYFLEQEPSVFALMPEIRDQVSFHHINVISDAIASDMKEMDVIFFRNVSIYFDQPTRLAIQQKITTMLKPGGYLIVGMTESMSNNFGLLRLQNEHDLFFFEKVGIDTSVIAQKRFQGHIESVPRNVSASRLSRSQTNTQPTLANVETIADVKALIARKDYDAALDLLKNLATGNPVSAEHLLLHAFILFNRQAFDEAQRLVQQALEIEPLSIDGFLLQGMIGKWQQHPEQAIECFKKAVYLHADCWPAHYYLSGLYREAELWLKAVQEYRLVLRQLDEPGENFCSRLTMPLALPKAEIRLLCQSHLEKLTDNTAVSVSGRRYGD